MEWRGRHQGGLGADAKGSMQGTEKKKPSKKRKKAERWHEPRARVKITVRYSVQISSPGGQSFEMDQNKRKKYPSAIHHL